MHTRRTKLLAAAIAGAGLTAITYLAPLVLEAAPTKVIGYGVPLPFYEVVCRYGCSGAWSIPFLVVDVLAWSALLYGAEILGERRAGKRCSGLAIHQ